jgi:hypothetical protein
MVGLAGAALLAGSRSLFAAGTADALLLHCIDYRLTNETTKYMNGRGLDDKYDELSLAGASLAATLDQRPDWEKTFWEHLDIAIDLHQIHEVIVIDHRDCGAYATFLDMPDLAKDPKKELEVHAEYMRKLKVQIGEKKPALTVELLLMDLHGNVAEIK